MQERSANHVITAQQIASLPQSPYHGYAFRQQSPKFDPRSGEGARQFGGRFNPPASFATLYVTPSINTAAAELVRQGQQHVVGMPGLLPRDVYRYSLGFTKVIDLTTVEIRGVLAIDKSDLTSSDRIRTRIIGEAAFGLGIQALVSYSAACGGLVIAIFLENLHGCDIKPELVDHWAHVDQVNDASGRAG